MNARPARGSRVVQALGVVLILGGLGILGWLVWQMFGTSYVSQQEHERIVRQLEEQWGEGRGTTEAESAVRTPKGDAIAIVRIPRFGDDYAVPVLSGTSDEVLASGFGHFEDSARPGGPGNFALAGHRVTHGEPLRRMPELQPGDRVLVDTREATYTYELTIGGDDLEVTFRDVWVVQPRPRNPDPDGVDPPRARRLITLTTCSELFNTDNRLIAFGRLVDVRERTNA